MMESQRLLKGALWILLIAAGYCHALVAQTVQIGLGGGILFPTGDAGGDTKEYYAGTKYGLSTGYTLQAKGRFGLAGVTLSGQVSYSHMSNSGESEPGQGNVEVSQTLFTIKAGPEFHFKLPLVTPYVGANLAYNSVSGETKFNGVARVPSGTYDVKTASRFGFGLMAGGIVSLGGALALDVNLDYAWINPFTKQWDAPGSNARIDSYRALNDDRDPLAGTGDPDEHFIRDSRSIGTFAVTVTLMFGL